MSKKKKALRYKAYKAYLDKVSNSPGMLQLSKDYATFQNKEWTDEAITSIWKDADDGMKSLCYLGYVMGDTATI